MEIDKITEKVIGSAFSVANALGVGFLEKVYENALAYEIAKGGLQVKQQSPIQVYYDGIVVGEYFTDLLIEGQVLVELKHIRELDDIHMAQCLNYLRATGKPVCLLISFGRPRIQIKRLVPNINWKPIDQ